MVVRHAFQKLTSGSASKIAPYKRAPRASYRKMAGPVAIGRSLKRRYHSDTAHARDVGHQVRRALWRCRLVEAPRSSKQSPQVAKPSAWTSARLLSSSRALNAPYFLKLSWIRSNDGLVAPVWGSRTKKSHQDVLRPPQLAACRPSMWPQEPPARAGETRSS